jgi:LmbE family N-acetylglucosaminyl deacetylase
MPRRAVIVAAHPDDEAIGVGAQLSGMGEVLVVHVTDGAPRDLVDARAHGFGSREAYAEARRREAAAALAAVGLPEEALRSLGAVDQEASLALAALSLRLADLLGEVGPCTIFAHPYEGGHPDHDAAAFAAHAARALLAGAAAADDEAYPIVEFASYFADLEGRFGAGDFLRPNAAARPDPPPAATVTLTLGAGERDRKRAMLAAYATQAGALAPFPEDVERTRRAPRYIFTTAPHPGRLLFESFPWGMDGARWRRLARQSLDDLRLDPEAPL